MNGTEDAAAREAHDAASVLASLASHSPTTPFQSSASFSLGQDDPTQSVEDPAQPNGIEPVSNKAAPPPASPSSRPTSSTPALKPDTEELDPSLDPDTLAAINAATNEHGTRIRKPAARPSDFISTPELTAPEMTQKAITNKRSAPTDGKKGPAKKRKSEGPSDRDTPASNRASSPASSSIAAGPKTSKATKTSGSKKGKAKTSTATPRPSTPLVNGFTNGDFGSPGSAASDMSDDTPYCICRRPDNGDYMVACDGGCNDWYHGKCVNMKEEDAPLIDQYVCPRCAAAGKGGTTWKPKCRNGGCNNPARLTKGNPSKYCSEKCGVTFMEEAARRSAGQVLGAEVQNRPAKRRKTDPSLLNGASETDVGPLGGALRPAELKALTASSAGVDSFRQIGSEAYQSPGMSEAYASKVRQSAQAEPEYTLEQQQRLHEIKQKKDILRHRRLVYKDREAFIGLMKARIPKLKEKLGMKKEKEYPCGFDPHWSLSDISFNTWRNSEEGKAAFDSGELPVPDDAGEASCQVCTRKSGPSAKCGQHGSWQPLLLKENRNESGEIGRQMRDIDTEERNIVAAAQHRAWRSALKHVDSKEEGWVEVVGSDDELSTARLTVTGAGNKLDAAEALGDLFRTARVKVEDDIRPAYPSKSDEGGPGRKASGSMIDEHP